MPRVASSPFDLVTQRCSDDIERTVRNMKQDRDNWEAIARRYEQACKTLEGHFFELLHVHVATQAELTNEQTASQRLRHKLELIQKDSLRPAKGSDDTQSVPTSGRTLQLEPVKIDADGDLTPLTCVNFRKAEQFTSQGEINQALTEVGNLLRGPLSSDARVEGLLLKSAILRGSHPDSLLDALQACSEALEICNQLADLKQFMSKIQYYRGVCYYQLKMLEHAQNAFAAVDPAESFYSSAMDYRKSCEKELNTTNDTLGRSGFDEARSITEIQPSRLMESERDCLRRRIASTQINLFTHSKSRRMSLPSRWFSHNQRNAEQDDNRSNQRAAEPDSKCRSYSRSY